MKNTLLLILLLFIISCNSTNKLNLEAFLKRYFNDENIRKQEA
ncbi:hypothetical protein [Putridiphycobacter roseus]|nr:hypothetical protein [Putridiphycobacter roseus]